ncbi:YqiA/YcfP family alpha/beta fold hydrolase [Litoribrevibacter albus]|uniref:Esterase YqiA n=1 Tax=Litoribrevibacter albus TaxID=1473156 RepID=A0AA37SBV6_9GAMM|nr:YqiA/YcfP family alpha/beta fold hydrolase [Litoribrevibacter albus]GLQ32491.1 esterase YqiA [Litoribrevibacter albus]
MSSLIYIHGFNSSPNSTKARIIGNSLDILGFSSDNYIVPDLNYEPDQAIAKLVDCIETLLARQEDIYLIGSSLGGFYATYLAEKYGLKTVLVNPAIRPYELLMDYLGPNKNIYTGEEYDISEEHVAQLKALDISSVTSPSDYLVLVQTDDETLDYRQATNKFWQSPLVIEYGGNHSFEDFQSKLILMKQFFSPPTQALS